MVTEEPGPNHQNEQQELTVEQSEKILLQPLSKKPKTVVSPTKTKLRRKVKTLKQKLRRKEARIRSLNDAVNTLK